MAVIGLMFHYVFYFTDSDISKELLRFLFQGSVVVLCLWRMQGIYAISYNLISSIYVLSSACKVLISCIFLAKTLQILV